MKKVSTSNKRAAANKPPSKPERRTPRSFAKLHVADREGLSMRAIRQLREAGIVTLQDVWDAGLDRVLALVGRRAMVDILDDLAGAMDGAWG